MHKQGSSSTRDIEARLARQFKGRSGFWGCKDRHSVFLYANEEYGRIIGVRHHLDVVGRTDFDMPCDTTACAQAFRDQDHEVMETGKTLRILDIHPYAHGEWKAYLTTKTPLYDETGRVAGTTFHGEDLTSPVNLELGTLLGRLYLENQHGGPYGPGSYRIGKPCKMPVALTQRESEVLFFFIRGQSARNIANIFGISVRTVETHIVTLRRKFACFKRANLVEKAIYLGYLHCIPGRLFTRQLSMVLRHS